MDVTASRNVEGIVNLTLTNVSLDQKAEVKIDLGHEGRPRISGEILTSDDIRSHNDFDRPDTVKPVEFTDFRSANCCIIVKMPAKSIISLSIKL